MSDVDKQQRWSTWRRNVVDKYKGMPVERIRDDLRSTAHPFSVLMEHWHGDFNISTLIRNANVFNAERVFYLGRRGFDRRGTVGAHHYVDLNHLSSIENLLEFSDQYTLVALDNNISDCISLTDFEWPQRPLMIFGEEGTGITDTVLDICDHRVSIPQWGSIRSLNVGTSSGIVMYDYVNKLYAGKRNHLSPTLGIQNDTY